jgi:3'(2'), 5'-bisphosphate nucleotidase
VVLVPAKDQLFYAARGQGAFLQVGGGAPRRLAVSVREKPEEMILAKSRSHSGPREAALIEKYGFADVLPKGSSLKGCMVATGDADLYFRFGPTNEWDICAMHAVVAEAGGSMTDLRGAPMRYNQAKTLNDGFVASNGRIHEKLVEMAAE